MNKLKNKIFNRNNKKKIRKMFNNGKSKLQNFIYFYIDNKKIINSTLYVVFSWLIYFILIPIFISKFFWLTGLIIYMNIIIFLFISGTEEIKSKSKSIKIKEKIKNPFIKKKLEVI